MVNRRDFYIDEINFKKHGLKGEVITDEPYYMINPSCQSQFLVSQLVKWWLTVENFVLIVVSNYLTTVPILRFSERSPLDQAKTSTKPLKK